jgi:hypothetical protein
MLPLSENIHRATVCDQRPPQMSHLERLHYLGAFDQLWTDIMVGVSANSITHSIGPEWHAA